MAACKKTLHYVNPNPRMTYTYRCAGCGWQGDRRVEVQGRDAQLCDKCRTPLVRAFYAAPIFVPEQFRTMSRRSEVDRERSGRNPRYHTVVKPA